MLNEIRAINRSLAKMYINQFAKEQRKERRTVCSPQLNFLKNISKESDFDKDLDTTVIKLINAAFYKRS